VAVRARRTVALTCALLLGGPVLAAATPAEGAVGDVASPADVLRAEQAIAREVGAEGYLVRFDDPTLAQRLRDLVTAGRTRDGLERVEVAVEAAGGEVVREVWGSGPGGIVLADLTDAQALALLDAPGVSAVVPNLRVETTGRRRALTQDTVLGAGFEFWNLDRIDRRARTYDTTYHYSSTGSAVDVYVLDTGIRLDHIDFVRADNTSSILPASTFGGSYFFIAGDDILRGEDCDGHGTHVAGTVAGRFSGAAKGANVVPVRIFPFCSGGGSTADIISGLDWVVANRRPGVPAVINMSLGARLGPSPSAGTIAAFTVYDQVVADVIAAGFTVVVAAGNRNEDACWSWPARIPAVITVGAIDAADVRSEYFDASGVRSGGSNYGTCVDVFAPGSDILSACGIADTAPPYNWLCTRGSFIKLGGTSMASPLVAGLAARHLEANPTATHAQVATAIVDGAWSGLLGEFLAGTAWDDLGSPNLLANTHFLEPPPTTVRLPVVVPCAAGDAASGLEQLVDGGVAPLTWSVTSGALPGDLALSAAGRLTGSRGLLAGIGAVTVRVEDVFGRTASTVLDSGSLPPGCD